MSEQLDRKDMKILALKQRLAEVVVEYEDRDAERRIEITELSEALQSAHSEIARLNTPEETNEEAPTDES